ncbi:hypothetical protein B2J93_7560 [Marssonina coronariae]|uniref:Thioredoxin domain-containing protein n=1 Tax=Diplocarpon coronariae TaxID=2795749 RepID=A0A218Z704_9HELO|nr:hypothetical protein B2J93_7560 [Marssonina coronariae]
MRLLPVLCTLFASSAIAESSDSNLEGRDASVADADDAEKGPDPTMFNGVEVPPLLDIDGEKFNATIEEGWWFVKHHSPYCPHCLHVAPTWQTLYEYYYTSKPVPSADASSTSLNSFTSYYNFHFGNLDCIAFGTACADHQVRSFPTFIMFKDGEETKRFEGAKDMQTISKFIEETLESFRPGSRPVEGPELPEIGAKSSKDYQGPESPEPSGAAQATAAEPVADQTPLATGAVTETTIKPTVSQDIKEEVKVTPSASSVKINPAKQPKKPVVPVKPTAIPNTTGKTISFTAESFQKQVTMTQEPWFIKFYAPWCHHCQAMAPNWVQLAKEMKGKLNVGEVNCEVESRLCKDVRVRGYPTILFFRGGERVEYDGLRGLGDLVSYANKAIDVGDGVKDIDALEFGELEEKEEVIFLYFYDHATTTEDFAALERLTLSLIGHAKLVKTNSAILAERYKITTWPRLLVSRDGRPTYYTALAPKDMRDFRQVLNWMQSVWLPIVPELTASNAREIMDGKLVVLGILSRERSSEFMMAKKEIKSAALEWMDKETIAFQRERQELRDAKQLRLEEAEDRNDQRALRAAKSIRINMDKSDHKEVGFAWVDGVFWERWIRTTYGIEVARDGEKVIINDEDQRRYWDTTITGNSIMASRTSILETIPKVVASPPKIKPKSTISNFQKFFFDIRGAIKGHPLFAVAILAGIFIGATWFTKGRTRPSRGGYLRLEEKDGLLGGPANGKFTFPFGPLSWLSPVWWLLAASVPGLGGAQEGVALWRGGGGQSEGFGFGGGDGARDGAGFVWEARGAVVVVSGAGGVPEEEILLSELQKTRMGWERCVAMGPAGAGEPGQSEKPVKRTWPAGDGELDEPFVEREGVVAGSCWGWGDEGGACVSRYVMGGACCGGGGRRRGVVDAVDGPEDYCVLVGGPGQDQVVPPRHAFDGELGWLKVGE